MRKDALAFQQWMYYWPRLLPQQATHTTTAYKTEWCHLGIAAVTTWPLVRSSLVLSCQRQEQRALQTTTILQNCFIIIIHRPAEGEVYIHLHQHSQPHVQPHVHVKAHRRCVTFPSENQCFLPVATLEYTARAEGSTDAPYLLQYYSSAQLKIHVQAQCWVRHSLDSALRLYATAFPMLL